jgi:hypothetical protein
LGFTAPGLIPKEREYSKRASQSSVISQGICKAIDGHIPVSL